MSSLIATPLNLNFPSCLKYIDSAESFNAIPIIKQDAFEYLKEAEKVAGVTRFIFIRHGESTSNVEKSIAGRTLDVDLSEKGKIQASEVGKKLREIKVCIDRVYTSPSLRTLRTAEQISDKETLPDDRLYEKFYGPYEGASEEKYKPVEEAEKNHNCGVEKTFVDKFQFKYHPDMESMADVYDRVSCFIEDKHQEHRSDNILATAHNGVMKALFLCAAAKLGYDVDYRSFTLGNASVIVLEIYDSEIKVLAANGLKYRSVK